MAIVTKRSFQFSLSELLILTTACAVFWAFCRLVASHEVYSFCVGSSLAGLLFLGFSMASVRSGHIGLRSKMTLAAASFCFTVTLLLLLSCLDHR